MYADRCTHDRSVNKLSARITITLDIREYTLLLLLYKKPFIETVDLRLKHTHTHTHTHTHEHYYCFNAAPEIEIAIAD